MENLMDIPPRALMDEHSLRDVVERAAEAGARRALEQLGLHDANAASDVRELRGLLQSCRDARSTMWQTIVRLGTTALLAALMAGSALLFLKERP
jgi:hypothetical protein